MIPKEKWYREILRWPHNCLVTVCELGTIMAPGNLMRDYLLSYPGKGGGGGGVTPLYGLYRL